MNTQTFEEAFDVLFGEMIPYAFDHIDEYKRLGLDKPKPDPKPLITYPYMRVLSQWKGYDQ